MFRNHLANFEGNLPSHVSSTPLSSTKSANAIFVLTLQTFTKDHIINTSGRMLCYVFVSSCKLLQRIISSTERSTHAMLCFCIILQTCYKDHSIPENQHISRRQLTHCWNESPFQTFTRNFNWISGWQHSSPDLQRIREYSNLGLSSTFHLNHFKVIYVSKKLSFVIILQSLCSPNEDFGSLNKI